jgi:hypothetical protein
MGEKLESVDAIECPRQGSNAPTFARRSRRSIVVLSNAPVREVHSSHSPVLEVFWFLGFW